MPKLTIELEIPTGKLTLPQARNRLAKRLGYKDEVTDPNDGVSLIPNPLTKMQFIKRHGSKMYTETLREDVVGERVKAERVSAEDDTKDMEVV